MRKTEQTTSADWLVGPHPKGYTLPVVETFHSLQGEGFWTGHSAFFIRLAGCDVGCPWCDTKHSWPMRRHPRQSIEDLVQEAVQSAPQFGVITGGEPLMHDLTVLTERLQAAGLRVHLETSGAHPLSGHFDWITLSPKPFNPPLPAIYPHAQELKMIIQAADDLIWAEQQAAKVSENTVLLLQPEWDSPQSQSLVFDYVRQHPRWQMSLQTHKYLGVR
jgi:7-carboxy-7-deazaguanine synthase